MKLNVSLALLAGSLSLYAERPAKPNIILLLTDDLGWQDVKCYDIDEPSPMETPNLDALAKDGVMFWQAYSPAPTCGPSRCAIMSGTHPARANMTHVSGGKPPHPHHPTGWNYMSPWYTASMPVETVTIADALKTNGYTTGHSGKWHMSMNHHGYPQPKDQGFDFSEGSRGVQSRMQNRIKDFATTDPKHPFRLDPNGFPYDQTTADAMKFLDQSKGEPFFLYFATWLVHGPWHTYSEQLLNKYVEKLGVELTPEAKDSWKVEGQNNPFYCAMVEQLDYYIGGMIDYLKTTDDPRWPGHKLIENTYIIVSSDNGGMCNGGRKEVVTTNKPLQKGKISAMEGGTRVPLIVYGPTIPKGIQSDVMVNGLDFYPTILSLTGTATPKNKHFDGCDLSSLLERDPRDAKLVLDSKQQVRDTMIWHFPNSAAQESTIRIGDYKLVRNYFDKPALELYRLYDSSNGTQKRVDIEEAKNLAESMPEKTNSMNAALTAALSEMDASYPHLNPNSPRNPLGKKAPTVSSSKQSGRQITVTYQDNGTKLNRADLIYTKNGNDRYEEWFRVPATIGADNTINATLPKGTTHFFINLIDANNFLVSFPKIDRKKMTKKKAKYAGIAIAVE
ncbi:sulfatase [Rubritalea marina]|uniref:sulfatase n=1 Tax=Rubritalea marina TaxID=361055 RepID=UPI0003635F17|nr:sulfatase [Rubritalea marina]